MATLDSFREAAGEPIQLDLANGYIADVRLNSGDVNGRTITVELTDNGTPITTTDGITCEVDERSTAVEIDAPTGGAATLFFEPQAMESFAKLLTFEEMRGEARKTAPKADMIDQLERLAGLHEKGHLTDEEFEQAKARLLGKI